MPLSYTCTSVSSSTNTLNSQLHPTATMPGPGQNKWSADAERDLAMAIILSHGNITHDWPAVADKMTAWGYTFTLGSMS